MSYKYNVSYTTDYIIIVLQSNNFLVSLGVGGEWWKKHHPLPHPNLLKS